MRQFSLCLLALPFVALACTASSASAPVGPTALADAGSPDVAADAAAATEEPTPEPQLPACEPIITSTSKAEGLLSKEASSADRVWIYRAQQGETMLTLSVREKQGGPTEPADGTFGEEQLQTTTAGVTLLVQTSCEAHEDHFHCGPSFIPTAGSWSFSSLGTSVGKRITGRISADLVQATIKSGVATPKAGGESLCLRDLVVDAVLAAP